MDRTAYAINLVVDLIDINDMISNQVVSDYLIMSGFDESDVRKVFDIIDIDRDLNIEAVRVFSKDERIKFYPEALEYLNKIYLTGILGLIAIDEIIDKATTEYDERVTIEVVKELTLLTLLEGHKDDGLKIIKNDMFQ